MGRNEEQVTSSWESYSWGQNVKNNIEIRLTKVPLQLKQVK